MPPAFMTPPSDCRGLLPVPPPLGDRLRGSRLNPTRDDPVLERYLAAARSLGFSSRIHADGKNPTAAVSLALTHRVAGIDHLEHATEFHARQLAAADMMVTLLPGISFHNDGQTPPARALVDSGAAIALGTNFNPHHTPMLNMQTVVALACWRLRLTLEEAITGTRSMGPCLWMCRPHRLARTRPIRRSSVLNA